MADIQRPSRMPVEPGIMGEIQSEVAVEATPLLTFVLTNIRLIVGGVLILVAITVGYGLWQWNQASTLRDAEIAFGRIVVGTPGAAKVTALESFVDKAPASMRNGVLLAMAAAAVEAGEIEKAAAAYGRLYSGDPKGALGLVSALNQADLLQRLGKPAEATTVLDTLAVSAPDVIKTMVREELAVTAEQSGQFEKALGLYETLLTPSGGATGGVEPGYYQFRVKAIKARMAAKS